MPPKRVPETRLEDKPTKKRRVSQQEPTEIPIPEMYVGSKRDKVTGWIVRANNYNQEVKRYNSNLKNYQGSDYSKLSRKQREKARLNAQKKKLEEEEDELVETYQPPDQGPGPGPGPDDGGGAAPPIPVWIE